MYNWGDTAEKVHGTIEDNRGEFEKVLVILSGGMDSATCLAAAAACSNDVPGAITFDYGQTHTKENVCAREIGFHFDTDVKTINLNNLAGNFKTALSKDSNIEIPEGATEDVPPTYVPFRNTIMLSIAAGYAESWGYTDIFYGANIVDYSGYPDCRPSYVDKMNQVLDEHNCEIQIHAPICYLTKSDVVLLGTELKVPWDFTWSCYRGGQHACGKCPSCEYRIKGFSEAGIPDPIVYDTEIEWPIKI